MAFDTYELRVYRAYDSDDVYRFDSLEKALDHLRLGNWCIDDVDIYLSPTPIDIAAHVGAENIHKGKLKK